MKVSAFPAITKRIDILMDVNYLVLGRKCRYLAKCTLTAISSSLLYTSNSLFQNKVPSKCVRTWLCQLVGARFINTMWVRTELNSSFLTVLYSAVGGICCQHVPMY